MDAELLRELIEYVKSAGGVVWDAAYRQVYVGIAIDFIWGVAFCVGIRALSGWYFNLKNEQEEDYDFDRGFGMAFILGGIIICAMLALWAVTNITSALINPEWQVISNMLSLMQSK